MDNTQKYLDSAGLAYFWGKVKEADAAMGSTKGGYINLVDKFICLWPDEESSKVEGAHPLSKFDATDFLADGMLQNVEVVENPTTDEASGTVSTGTFIKFTWTLNDGTTKVEYLDASKIGKIYSAGEGISITGENNAISISSVKTESTKVTQRIPVAGGPLAELLNAKGITEIEEGQNLQDLFFSLFCKEEWPTSTSFSDGSASVSIPAPSFTLTNTSGTVEVGTKCNLGEVTVSAATASVGSYPKVSGFTYGYSAEDDNTKDNGATEISATVKTAAALNGDNYTLSIDYTLFNAKADAPNVSTNAAADQVKYDAQELIASEGTNKVKATVKGPKATVTFNSISPYYVCSNVGKTRSGETAGEGVYHKSENVSEKSYTSNSSQNSKELTVSAKYKYFAGHTDITDINSLDSATIRSITDLKSNWVTIDGTTTVIGNTATATTANKSVMFAVPSKYKMVIPEALSGTDLATDPTTFTTKTVSVKCGELDVDYTVYFAVITSGNISVKNVQIVKK